MYLKSGYKTVTGVQLLNALALLQAKRITFRCFRVYLASFAATAIREAASRARRKEKSRGKERVARYRICELARLCAVTEGEARRDLRTLASEKLLSFSETNIVPLRDVLPACGELMELVRSPTRPVPIPRAVLRFLARGQKRAVSTAMIAYMLRGLTLAKMGGEISGKGSAKLSWIAAVAGVSERGAAYARKELIHLGWISPDTGSKQWKLNRHGAYFSINLAWEARAQSEQSRSPKLAPLTVSEEPSFAPPIENRKTPYGSKNQKTSSGVSTKRAEEGEAPNLRNVKTTDLFSISKCEALYWQAIGDGIFPHSESSVLNFLSAAIRARSIKKGDPARVFITLIRRQLWNYITFEQEDVARVALFRIRETNPLRFRTFETLAVPHERTLVPSGLNRGGSLLPVLLPRLTHYSRGLEWSATPISA